LEDELASTAYLAITYFNTVHNYLGTSEVIL